MNEEKVTDEAIVMELCRQKQFLLEEQERTGNTPNTQLVYVTGEAVFEILDLIKRLHDENERLTKELSNVPDPFPCKVGSGCEAAGQSCYDCPNNRYRQQVAKEILQEGKHCLSKSLQDWIKERYGMED